MRILRHRDCRRMPWKNGLGVTEEVIAFPAESNLLTFGWRVSIAHVGADGPFSVFPGIDRSIALLDGEGLLLDLPDRTIELDPKSQPFAFSGDLKISSRNKSGPTVDLNIMTRRNQFRHEIHRLEDIGDNDGRASSTIFVFNASHTITVNGTALQIQRFDALIIDHGDQLRLKGDNKTDVIGIQVFEVK